MAQVSKERYSSERFLQELNILGVSYLNTPGEEPYLDPQQNLGVPLPRVKPTTGVAMLDQIVDLGLGRPVMEVSGSIYPGVDSQLYDLQRIDHLRKLRTGIEVAVWPPETNWHENDVLDFAVGTTGGIITVLHAAPLDDGTVYLGTHKEYQGGETGSHGELGAVYVLQDGVFVLNAAILSAFNFFPVPEDINYHPWGGSDWHITNALLEKPDLTTPTKSHGKPLVINSDGDVLKTNIQLRPKYRSTGYIDNMAFQIPLQVDPKMVLQSVAELSSPVEDIVIKRLWTNPSTGK